MMKNILLVLLINFSLTSCQTLNGFFQDDVPVEDNNYEHEMAHALNDIQNKISTDMDDSSTPSLENITNSLSNLGDTLTPRGCNKTKRLIIQNMGEISSPDDSGNFREILPSQNEDLEPHQDYSVQEKLKMNFSKLGGSSEAVEQALCFFNKNKDKKFTKKVAGSYKNTTNIENQDYMVIQDFTLRSIQKRFFLLNMKTGEIETMYSSLGYGTNGPRSQGVNFENDSKYFSNDKYTKLTPRGFMVTDTKRHLSPSRHAWKWNLTYDGLQKGLNDNSRDRAILFHQAVRSTDFNDKIVSAGLSSSSEEQPELFLRDENGDFVSNYYNPGAYSNGCTSVASDHYEYVYDKIKGRSLSYNFTQHEKDLGASYCGDDSMLKENNK